MVQKQEFYRQTIQEAAASLHTDPKRGLSAQEAERRLWENGENRLPEAEKKSVLQSFLEQLNDPLIYMRSQQRLFPCCLENTVTQELLHSLFA